MNQLSMFGAEQPQMPPASVYQMVKAIKEADQDFEWYPTTTEIIDTVKANMHEHFYIRADEKCRVSLLDIGAGDGRVLMQLTEGDRYAIEKSMPLIEAMPKDVLTALIAVMRCYVQMKLGSTIEVPANINS